MPGVQKKNAKKKPQPKKPIKAVGYRSAPAAQSRTLVTKIPNVVRKPTSVRMVHREYFATVGTTGGLGAFETTTYMLQPGNASVFPWLSTQAAAWERYKFHRLSVEYVPRCATSQPGSLILSPDYDAADDAPVSEPAACSYADAVSCVPWSPAVLRCNPQSMLGGMTTKFVRVGVLKNNLDIKTYDSASLFVCADVASAAATWGKLWVDYDVEFFTPHTIPIPWTSTLATSLATGTPAATPFQVASTLGAVIGTSGPISVKTPAGGGTPTATVLVDGLTIGGKYLIQVVISALAGTTLISSTMLTGLTGLNHLGWMISNINFTPSGAGAKTVMYESIVQAIAQNGAFTAALTGAAVRAAQVIISPIVDNGAWSIL